MLPTRVVFPDKVYKVLFCLDVFKSMLFVDHPVTDLALVFSAFDPAGLFAGTLTADLRVLA